MKTIISLLLLLTVVKLIHCQDHEQMIVLTLQGILQNLESINGQLKGHDELLQRIPDMQEKLQHLENNLQDVQQEQENQKTYFQGLSRETARCLKGEDLEHLTNVSTAANQEIQSFHEEMSEVIAWSRKDKCSEGRLLCGELRSCKNNPFSFTCSCPSGFTWDGSECKDVDECAEGEDECVPNAICRNSIGSYSCYCNRPFKGDGRTSCDVDECAEGEDECVPNAICRNSIGSYSCYCNRPFKGDGRTSCEFECRSPAKPLAGVGCVKQITPSSTFTVAEDKCKEEGGRLAQHISLEQIKDFDRSFGLRSLHHGRWVGVYDGRWTSDGSLVPEALWLEGYRSDPSRRCAILGWDSSSFKLEQRKCSDMRHGFCQFPMP